MALTPIFVNPHGQGSRTIWKQSVDASAAQETTGAGGASSVVTITAAAQRKIEVGQVFWSYDAAPTGGGVTISDGTTSLTWAVTASGFDSVTFDPPLAFAVGTNVVVTLAAPGGSVVGKLIVNAWVRS